MKQGVLFAYRTYGKESLMDVFFKNQGFGLYIGRVDL